MGSVIPPSAEAPAPATLTPDGRPCAYPAAAILTQEEVAAVLGVDVRTVQRYGIRKAVLGRRTTRYLYRDVVTFIEQRAA